MGKNWFHKVEQYEYERFISSTLVVVVTSVGVCPEFVTIVEHIMNQRVAPPGLATGMQGLSHDGQVPR